MNLDKAKELYEGYYGDLEEDDEYQEGLVKYSPKESERDPVAQR